MVIFPHPGSILPEAGRRLCCSWKLAGYLKGMGGRTGLESGLVGEESLTGWMSVMFTDGPQRWSTDGHMKEFSG